MLEFKFICVKRGPPLAVTIIRYPYKTEISSNLICPELYSQSMYSQCRISKIYLLSWANDISWDFDLRYDFVRITYIVRIPHYDLFVYPQNTHKRHPHNILARGRNIELGVVFCEFKIWLDSNFGLLDLFHNYFSSSGEQANNVY